MADNVTLNAGSGGSTLATEDVASVHHQKVKIEYGLDGVATLVSDTDPLPVDDAGGSLTVDNAGTFAVQVDAAIPAGTNAIGKLTANSGVDIGDVDVTSQPADTFVTEAGALGKGVLLQGDDGTDRKNVNVDATTGDVQVDVTNTVTVSGTVTATPAATGGGTEASAQRVTIANNSTGVLTVDGTVTANLSTTDNTVLDNIQTSVDTVAAAVVTQMQVDVVSDPVLLNTTDAVKATLDATALMDGAVAMTVKRANVATAASGVNTLIAAVVGKTTRILSVAIFTTAAVNAWFNDGTADLFGDATSLIKLDNTGAVGALGFILPYNPQGWFETAADNRAIILNLSGAIAVGGTITYVEV